jgi:hypothetical protein
MLRYLKLPNFGDRVERAIYDTCVRASTRAGRGLRG